MGLDQNLIKFDKRKDNIPLDVKAEHEAGNSIDIKYWRKANQIHGWMGKTVGPIDNCEFYHISREQIQELLDTCIEVQTRKDLDYNNENLPITTGFFFGTDEYDDWYYSEVEETIESLQKILEETNFDYSEIYYWSWW